MPLITPFLWFTGTLGVQRIPPSTDWKTTGWVCSENRCELTATTHLSTCPPGAFLVAPAVIHASHRFFLDGRPVFVFGDPTGHRASPFYNQPVVPCEVVSPGDELTWNVRSHTNFFARVPYWPEVRTRTPWQTLFYGPLQAGASIALLALSVLVAVLYDVRNLIVAAFCTSCVAMALYFALCTASLLLLPVSPLVAHKIADISVWVGIVYTFTVFRLRDIIHEHVYVGMMAFAAVGILVMLFAGTGDTVQAGTMLPFGMGFLAASHIAIEATRAFRRQPTRRRLVEALAAVFFVTAGGNEMLVVLGVLPDSPTCLQVGTVGLLLFLAMSVHEGFVETFADREDLRRQVEVGRLELKVARLRTELAHADANVRLKQLQIELLATRAESREKKALAEIQDAMKLGEIPENTG